jgi:hypothetical protein
MAVLKVGNGYQGNLMGLGVVTNLALLSEKRVTTAVRKDLRKHYGPENVEVSCGAKLAEGRWRGRCKIHYEPFAYEIYEVRPTTQN